MSFIKTEQRADGEQILLIEKNRLWRGKDVHFEARAIFLPKVATRRGKEGGGLGG